MEKIEWGKAVEGWRISASLDKNAFKLDEIIIVTVVFENVSERKLVYGAQGKDFDYILDCRNDRDEKMPYTLFGKRMEANRGMGKYITSELAPKEKLVNEICLTRHVDLSLPDRYRLTVSREIFPHEGRSEPPVVSNTCVFAIRE